MADRYVNSAATGLNNGTSWANAYTSLASAFTAAAAGDVVYIHYTHYQPIGANLALNVTGNRNNLVQFLSVDTDLSARVGARVRGVGSAGVVITGNIYVYGLDFSCEGYGVSGVGGSQDTYSVFEKCRSGNDAGGGNITNSGGYNTGRNEVTLIDCEFAFSGGNSQIGAACSKFTIIGGVITGSRTNMPLFRVGGGLSPSVEFRVDGLDVSAGMSTTAALFAGGGGATPAGTPTITRSKLAAGWTGELSSDAFITPVMDACDDGSSVLRSQTTGPQGSTYTETTVVRTDGANVNGQAMSYRLVASANAQPRHALQSRQMFRAYPGNATEDAAFVAGAAVTVTAEILTSNLALTDGQCWLEVTSFGTAGNVIGVTKSDERASVTATPANQTTSSVGWTTTGVSSPIKQKLQVTINPQHKGYITAVVKLARASTAVYLCPQLGLS